MTIAGSKSETRYLDLDGDGVPDAVETVTVVFDETRSGSVDAVEIVDELDADIDDDGVAHSVAVNLAIVSED